MCVKSVSWTNTQHAIIEGWSPSKVFPHAVVKGKGMEGAGAWVWQTRMNQIIREKWITVWWRKVGSLLGEAFSCQVTFPAPEYAMSACGNNDRCWAPGVRAGEWW